MTPVDLCAALMRRPRKIVVWLSRTVNRLRFLSEGVRLGSHPVIEGRVYVMRASGAEIRIGDNVHITGGMFINKLSRSASAGICAASGAHIEIGDNVGMSSPAIWAMNSITVCDNASVGADCIIMDHDAHSIDFAQRRSPLSDKPNIKSSPVRIGRDVWLGTRVIVLKGVTIGDRSIVGAGSVVTEDIPEGEIWAGNPAKFIRKV